MSNFSILHIRSLLKKPSKNSYFVSVKRTATNKNLAGAHKSLTGPRKGHDGASQSNAGVSKRHAGASKSHAGDSTQYRDPNLSWHQY